MISKKHIPKTIDEYIATFPAATQVLLHQLRNAIREAAPDATEKISYQMPTFFLAGNLVHFAAYQQHIGFYPASSGIAAFSEEISIYKNGKGSVQFPIKQALPLDLIKRIVRFRVQENMEKAVSKAKKKDKS